MQVPNHIAIIMDGNGRWATVRGKNRTYGHIKGSRRAKDIIEECSRLGLKHLTLYAFSVENWQRPEAETNFLMRILHKYVRREKENLIRQNIRFETLGNLAHLPPIIAKEIGELKGLTKANTGMNLNLALSYGGRQEITQAMRNACALAQAGRLTPDMVSEAYVNSLLDTHSIPDPDLVIRTSGERRLSNFMMWQTAYSEFYVTSVLWPDFAKQDLHAALVDFNLRKRRFGLTDEQIQSSNLT